MNRRFFCVLGLLLAACSSTRNATGGGERGFETLRQGYHSGIRTQSAVLVNDATQWAELWKRHASWQVPAEPAPQIDFATRSVLALFAGERPSGGWSLELGSVKPVDGRLEAHARLAHPAPGAIVPEVATQPYQLVTLPKASGTAELVLE